MNQQNRMRLFIASPVFITEFEKIKRDFSPMIYGNWSKEVNLHLTWSFLGEVDSAKEIIEKLRDIKPLDRELTIKGLGYFGEPPKVFWADVKSKILDIKAEEFKKAGFNMDNFRPHITLSRIKSLNSSFEFLNRLESYKNVELGIVKKEIILYKSQLTDKGPIYTKIWEII